MTTSYPPDQVAAFCAQWAPSLQTSLPPSIDAATLLYAFTGNESSFGANCTPRHEPAFDVGGPYAEAPSQAPLLVKFGAAGACSYGPFQIMLCNCPAGTTPDEMGQLDIAFMCSVTFMKKQFLRFVPNDVRSCGAIWNCGHVPRPGEWLPGVTKYANDLLANYQNPKVPFQASLLQSTSQ
jgi:hypothetical protein